MPMKKITISLPEPALKTVDRLAARRGESRSHVIAMILSRVARAKRKRDIAAQIDALFADDTLRAEQKRTRNALYGQVARPTGPTAPWPHGTVSCTLCIKKSSTSVFQPL
jgi:hypothetical protein